MDSPSTIKNVLLEPVNQIVEGVLFESISLWKFSHFVSIFISEFVNLLNQIIDLLVLQTKLSI